MSYAICNLQPLPSVTLCIPYDDLEIATPTRRPFSGHGCSGLMSRRGLFPAYSCDVICRASYRQRVRLNGKKHGRWRHRPRQPTDLCGSVLHHCRRGLKRRGVWAWLLVMQI